MRLKDLIKQLQDLYATYDNEYFLFMGEPEIMIDVFKRTEQGIFTYEGFSKDIAIEKTSDGVYDIIVATGTFG